MWEGISDTVPAANWNTNSGFTHRLFRTHRSTSAHSPLSIWVLLFPATAALLTAYRQTGGPLLSSGSSHILNPITQDVELPFFTHEKKEEFLDEKITWYRFVPGCLRARLACHAVLSSASVCECQRLSGVPSDRVRGSPDFVFPPTWSPVLPRSPPRSSIAFWQPGILPRRERARHSTGSASSTRLTMPLRWPCLGMKAPMARRGSPS